MAFFFLCILVSVSLLTHGDQSELRSQYEQLQSDIRYNLGPDNDMLSINPQKRRLQMEKGRLELILPSFPIFKLLKDGICVYKSISKLFMF